ncbi:NADH-quinone oxidoreductase subunit C [Streptomyces pratensis]|uniref:NADH-quinone oxidoreductase subunit C n=1 Tax=Streptomyces pratensis TaxID=1169025 RepID=UPI00301680F8
MNDHDVASAAAAHDRLPDGVTEVFGDEATAESAYDLLTVDVPATAWTTALRTARDVLGCTYFDWLSAVDEPGAGFRVCAHVAALGTGRVRRLMVRTTVPHEAAVLPTAVDVYAGAEWHERETHEMFGIAFEGHPHLVPLLLPEGFEGHPLRKDFVLAARVAKAWPGAKEPGESEHGGPKRRTMLPPGVPDPNEWGPLKGQLPAAAARPARAARSAADRPPRRARSASEGSAAQRPGTTAATPAPGAPARPSGETAAGASGEGAAEKRGPADSAPETPRTASAPDVPPEGSAAEAPPAADTPSAARPRRSRSGSQGSAGRQPPPDAAATGSAGERSARPARQDRPARRSRSASDGSASQRSASDASGAPAPPVRGRTADAPWHHARPAFDEPEAAPSPEGEGAGAGAGEPASPDNVIPNEAVTEEAPPNEAAPGDTPPDGAAPDRTPSDPDRPAGGDTE